MEEKILTLHPQGKQGVNISLEKYNMVKDVILEIIGSNENVTFSDLTDLAEAKLNEMKFDGKPLWYITTIKLDLEARNRVERIPKTSPHQLRVKS